ncbi:sulfotransferase [Simiduia sp. 21SJ11W-1]|uniref:sulfotransferase family protein n=1 Tax=Simiduia sp. 21SJ11W-1 TaxID=2909669 RepID=UPI00209F1F4C|nr:sulfotransferase [Simiduia sp. 21SJ11W-1]UTA48790.1 sulfotransferase [Simiduia sp. 21SJ11W-1]
MKENYDIDKLINIGRHNLAKGDLSGAQRISKALEKSQPSNSRATLFISDTAYLAGDFDSSLSHLSSLPTDLQNSIQIKIKKAKLLYLTRNYTQAKLLLKDIQPKLIGGNIHLLIFIDTLIDCGLIKEAHKATTWAISNLPRNEKALFQHALTCFYLNKQMDGRETCRRILEIDPIHAGAIKLRSMIENQTPLENNIEDLNRSLSMTDKPDILSTIYFSLGKEHECINDYEAAWENYAKANRIKRDTLKYDINHELDVMQKLVYNFKSDQSQRKGFENTGEKPIFIVGLPRTGTTLIEHAILQNFQAESIGEFTDFPIELQNQFQRPEPINFLTLGKSYLNHARAFAKGNQTTIDKLPYNFLYCGYILMSIPDAKIIHVNRNPLDAAYAIFKTDFNRSYFFSYNIDELGRYMLAYLDIMRTWKENFPDDIITINYEDYVSNPEKNLAKIKNFCQLEENQSITESVAPSKTASAVQIRQKPHKRSINSWKRAAPDFLKKMSEYFPS